MSEVCRQILGLLLTAEHNLLRPIYRQLNIKYFDIAYGRTRVFILQ